MLVIQSLIFKGDDNLQSIMFTMNVSILPALHQLPGDEMMLLEHGALPLLSAQSRKKISMSVFRNMLELLLECWKYPGLMGQHNRPIFMHVCLQQSPNMQVIWRTELTDSVKTFSQYIPISYHHLCIIRV